MEPIKPLASAMPDTAELVAELRQMLGTERVDAALAAGQRARREYARLEALKGRAHADAWLARQKWPQGCFWAREGEFQVGIACS